MLRWPLPSETGIIIYTFGQNSMKTTCCLGFWLVYTFNAMYPGQLCRRSRGRACPAPWPRTSSPPSPRKVQGSGILVCGRKDLDDHILTHMFTSIVPGPRTIKVPEVKTYFKPVVVNNFPGWWRKDRGMAQDHKTKEISKPNMAAPNPSSLHLCPVLTFYTE